MNVKFANKITKRMAAMLLVIALLLGTFAGCNKGGVTQSGSSETVTPNVVFKAETVAEMGDECKISDFLENVTDGTLENGEEVIDTSAVGTFEKTVKVLDAKTNKTVDFTFKITVRDTKAPVLTVPDKVTVVKGGKADLLKDVIVDDNSGETIVPIVTGNYDVNKIGNYELTLTAKDSAGNEATAKMTVSVVEQVKKEETPKTPAKPQKGLPAKTSTEKVIKKPSSYSLPYWVVIYREACTTVVYKADENGNYTVPVRVSVCSPGRGDNTTYGTFKMSAKYRWCTLIGPCYGQYSIRFNGHILFHSVPYQERRNDSLKYWLYNRLGRKDSLGCVRLTTADAKWLYDNCAIGTSVTVTGASLPSGIYKPSAKYISANDTKRRGWDPTDPDPKNPWGKYTDPNPVIPASKPATSSSKTSSTASSMPQSSSKPSSKPQSSSTPSSSNTSSGHTSSETSSTPSSSSETSTSEQSSGESSESSEIS
ncbi:MAG: L,D-transpeptidase family protein [Clostridia bacterium]|nr:L,D-transpeptidase family protein [Clostridia bacterium]